MITLDQLRSIIPFAGTRAATFLAPLNAAMAEFGINTTARQTAFLAQIAHESGSLRYVREIASGVAYEGREDLGNTEPGDGERFRGRGLIQITGRANMAECSVALYGDPMTLIDHPEFLELPVQACRSAAWFWESRGLNDLADKGAFERITRRINGRLKGLADRLEFYERAKKVLA